MNYKVLCIGNVSGFSGVPANLFPAIEKKREIVDIIDTKFSGFWNYYNYLYCFLRLPNQKKWLNPVHTIFHELGDFRPHTSYYILKNIEALQDKIDKVDKEYDIIFQASAIQIKNKHGKPHCIFTDCTPKQAERDYFTWHKFFSDNDKKLYEKTAFESYHDASKIFTASNYCRNSIINDYGVNEEKIV